MNSNLREIVESPSPQFLIDFVECYSEAGPPAMWRSPSLLGIQLDYS